MIGVQVSLTVAHGVVAAHADHPDQPFQAKGPVGAGQYADRARVRCSWRLCMISPTWPAGHAAV
ncbi:hypothetical protein VL21_16820 [Stenotrophomonas maltophilia]|nr:hypothetical protein VL21_16820 [Stenotrophomonas maltophilia]